MKRSMVACLGAWAAAALGAGLVAAASPQVETAIRTIEAVSADPAKLKLFCELNRLLVGLGDREDPEIQKEIDDIVAKLGPEFSAAWDIGDELDETTPDGQAFYTAVDTLADKCP